MDSLTNRKRNCQVEILEGVQVPAVERECEVRKDPSQEYFILVRFPQTTQAVKLNSPYMDAICTVPTRELYEKAQKSDIPFHKVRATQWYVWIENQLTNSYLDSLYHADMKRGRKRTDQFRRAVVPSKLS